MLKLGVEPVVVTLSTLINEFCNQSKISLPLSLSDEMIGKGYPPDSIAYNTILNRFCKTSKVIQVVRSLRTMN
ncbi:hypothetical protein GQ457_05G018890 [Hibiscus cannabinus]